MTRFNTSFRPRSGSGSSSNFRSRRPAGNKKRFQGDRIDENLFINKASKVVEEVYTSKNTFADFGIDPILAQNLVIKNYSKTTPIQDQAIPVILQKKDVIGIASTGTGKTAAFLIPLINKLLTDREHKVMILTPTRELAMQVENEFLSFARGLKLFSVSCVGGSPIMRQIKELERGVHVVIGTPGRVKDLIERGKINMKYFESIVLDEADRMLDMGFIDDMKEILYAMPDTKQGLFFSATFSPSIKALCSNFLRDPVTISVKTRDTSSSVDQDVVRVKGDDEKIEALVAILKQEDAQKVLIFREMKRHVDGLAEALQSRGLRVLALHGDMRNRERENAVASLASGRVQAIIATDVAARGIDIPSITHVINYDVPQTYDTYIHRIGRTGRADKKGKALTFVPR